ncbi:hypothetical protein VE00_05414 [Pseudogymnoascus sp. WSF 3629]|nr:hypothetical protein VE00_05414 [Pseudogymnoascus sp. WSF 3629]
MKKVAKEAFNADGEQTHPVWAEGIFIAGERFGVVQIEGRQQAFGNSAKFDRVIGTAVASRCTDSPQEAAASALSIFDSYCHLLSSPAVNTAIATTTGTGTTPGPTTAANSSVSWQTYTPVKTQSAPIPSASAATLNRTRILAVLAEIVCIGMLFNLLM